MHICRALGVAGPEFAPGLLEPPAHGFNLLNIKELSWGLKMQAHHLAAFGAFIRDPVVNSYHQSYPQFRVENSL
jgi:hypothetical protein